MRYLCLLALAVPYPSLLSAQMAEAEWLDAFEQKEIGQLSSRSTIREIDEKRSAVWQAWKQSRPQIFSFDCLSPLDSARTYHLPLPEELEPNAVMPFYAGTKSVCPATGYPLFLYLHGSGPKEHEWSTGLILAKRFKDTPSAYIVPQIPNEGGWYRWYQRSKQWAFEKMLRAALAAETIDPLRLYLFGISEGGYGSQRLASFYADYLAGAGPMAGGEPLVNAPAENLRHVAFSFLTGAEDKGFYRDRLTGTTAQALDSLERLHPGDYRHRVQLISGAGHSIDYSPTTPWLSQYTRRPRPTSFTWEDYEMDGRRRTGFYNIKVLQRPSGDTVRTRYDVNIEKNRVNIQVNDVHYTTVEQDPKWGIPLRSAKRYTPSTGGRIKLFLEENQVDLKKRVEVYINGRRVFRGRLRPSVEAMRESITTYFDPCRIFSAAIELAY